jgi:hypothetical protein
MEPTVAIYGQGYHSFHPLWPDHLIRFSGWEENPNHSMASKSIVVWSFPTVATLSDETMRQCLSPSSTEGILCDQDKSNVG